MSYQDPESKVVREARVVPFQFVPFIKPPFAMIRSNIGLEVAFSCLNIAAVNFGSALGLLPHEEIASKLLELQAENEDEHQVSRNINVMEFWQRDPHFGKRQLRGMALTEKHVEEILEALEFVKVALLLYYPVPGGQVGHAEMVELREGKLWTNGLETPLDTMINKFYTDERNLLFAVMPEGDSE